LRQIHAVSFLKPEHFVEELHRRFFEIAQSLFNAGKVVTPPTLKIFLGDQDLGGITLSQYLAHLVENAPNISEVKRLALTIYALSKYRSQVEVQEQEEQEALLT
jgi:replicative DNA helicase